MPLTLKPCKNNIPTWWRALKKGQDLRHFYAPTSNWEFSYSPILIEVRRLRSSELLCKSLSKSYLRYAKTLSVKNDAMFCYCLLISQQQEALTTLTSSQPFILLPYSISLLTSSLVSRQEDSCTKSLMGTETKQEKFPHPSKELKIFDNVPGLAQIKEGKYQLHSGPANDCLLPSSIMLENKIAK